MPRVKKVTRRKVASKRKPSVKRKVTFKKASVNVSRRRKAPSRKKRPSLVKQVSTMGRSIIKAYAPKVGAALGGYVGGGPGAVLGAKAGEAIGRIFGRGEYRITDNAILHGSQIPSFSKFGNATIVSHREYIADVSGTSAFTLTSYPINPGLSTSFPWLSTVANQYQEYKVLGMVYEFRTLAANAVGSTNTALGSVVMATNYNASEPNFISKLQMENSEFSSSIVPCDSMLHPIECKRSENVLGELYVRNYAVPTTTDARMYDLGNFQIATQGQQGTNVIGELWCSYQIAFYKPKLGVSGDDTFSAHYSATTGITTSAYFGSNTTFKSGVSNLTLTGTTITLPINAPLGNYMLHYLVTGGSASTANPSVALTSGASSNNILVGDTISYMTNGGTGATTVGIITYFKVTGSAAVITFSGGTLPASPVTMDLIITQMSDTITS